MGHGKAFLSVAKTAGVRLDGVYFLLAGLTESHFKSPGTFPRLWVLKYAPQSYV